MYKHYDGFGERIQIGEQQQVKNIIRYHRFFPTIILYSLCHASVVLSSFLHFHKKRQSGGESMELGGERWPLSFG